MFAQFCRNERMRAMAETSHSLTPAPRPATTWRRRQLATLSCLIHHCIAQKQPMQEIGELLRPKAQAQLQPNGQQSTPLNGQEEAPLNVRRTAMEGMSSDRFFDANVLEELPHWSANWTVAHHTVSNGGTAIAIDGFLPMHTAASFHAELQSSWQASAPCRMLGQCKSKSCAWLYTNNDKGGNGKVRSVWNVAERREHAKLLYQGRRFSYSKWELSDQHSLHAAVSVLMESKAVRNAIGKLVGLDTTATPLGNISDYFITAYDTGDFLSTHNGAQPILRAGIGFSEVVVHTCCHVPVSMQDFVSAIVRSTGVCVCVCVCVDLAALAFALALTVALPLAVAVAVAVAVGGGCGLWLWLWAVAVAVGGRPPDEGFYLEPSTIQHDIACMDTSAYLTFANRADAAIKFLPLAQCPASHTLSSWRRLGDLRRLLGLACVGLPPLARVEERARRPAALQPVHALRSQHWSARLRALVQPIAPLPHAPRGAGAPGAARVTASGGAPQVRLHRLVHDAQRRHERGGFEAAAADALGLRGWHARHVRLVTKRGVRV
eukprot:6173263-Pleurochrysis_carterae.AAC.3